MIAKTFHMIKILLTYLLVAAAVLLVSHYGRYALDYLGTVWHAPQTRIVQDYLAERYPDAGMQVRQMKKVQPGDAQSAYHYNPEADYIATCIWPQEGLVFRVELSSRDGKLCDNFFENLITPEMNDKLQSIASNLYQSKVVLGIPSGPLSAFFQSPQNPLYQKQSYTVSEFPDAAEVLAMPFFHETEKWITFEIEMVDGKVTDDIAQQQALAEALQNAGFENSHVTVEWVRQAGQNGWSRKSTVPEQQFDI